MVTTLHLAILKDNYDHHYSEYFEKKKNLVQRIWTIVWKSLQKDFLEKVRNRCITMPRI
jgi:hypothetical protein